MIVGDCLEQVFGCDFERDTVRYEHSGNPLLTRDSILLIVYQFSDAGASVERVLIPVTITLPAYQVTVQSTSYIIGQIAFEVVWEPGISNS